MISSCCLFGRCRTDHLLWWILKNQTTSVQDISVGLLTIYIGSACLFASVHLLKFKRVLGWRILLDIDLTIRPSVLICAARSCRKHHPNTKHGSRVLFFKVCACCDERMFGLSVSLILCVFFKKKRRRKHHSKYTVYVREIEPL